ncbi:hypothetical protein GCK72_011302 [Caenorhabditis remanei]|uniref:RING-type domain-containing protein n=1 Tax=Caenorhabditis remanei TaxID=31234 RepID=A0A6A5H769_CAERE|nr:hypothetical protein GCK72_011302 [Caenorhabditis remanei]KAF1763037.1 hypothetical protein GCK72_011302 [Caenorhabditis remanei]
MDQISRFFILIYLAVFITVLGSSLIYNACFPTFHNLCEGIVSLVWSCFTILFLAVIDEIFNAKYRQRNRIGQFQEFEFDSLCYFIAIALSGTILRVTFIFKGFSDTILLRFCWIFYLISVCSRIAIHVVGVKIGRFDLQHHKKLIIASTVFHVAITLATLRTTLIDAEDITRILEILWSQLGLGIISGVSTTEFLVVLTGGFRSLESDLRELNTERIDSDPIIECNICLVEFSPSRMPRILKKCGHTICESCADILLRQRYNLGIACPMCQTVTEHYESSSELPKNHAVLEFVEGIKTE